MRDLDRTYRLRRFRSSKDTGYAAAINVYLSSVAPDIRTNSNQITYWLDRGYGEFGDDFCVCGFYINEQLAGFAEFVFFRTEALLFIDYLSLAVAHQSQSEHLQFTRMVRDWIDRQPFEFDYAVTEIPFETSGPNPSDRALLEVQLYKQMGFGVAHCRYRQPPLGLGSPQSDMPAFLMLSGKQPISTIRADTAISIAHTVYFKHYLRWYQPFVGDPMKYEAILRDRFGEIERPLRSAADVKVNGMRTLSPATPASGSTSKPRARDVLIPSLFTLLCMLLFLSALFFIQHFADTKLEMAALLMGGSLIVFVAIFSLFHNAPRKTLDSLLSATIKVFGRRR